MEGKTLLDSDYADCFGDKKLSKSKILRGFLRVYGARIGMKIKVKKTKSLDSE